MKVGRRRLLKEKGADACSLCLLLGSGLFWSF